MNKNNKTANIAHSIVNQYKFINILSLVQGEDLKFLIFLASDCIPQMVEFGSRKVTNFCLVNRFYARSLGLEWDNFFRKLKKLEMSGYLAIYEIEPEELKKIFNRIEKTIFDFSSEQNFWQEKHFVVSLRTISYFSPVYFDEQLVEEVKKDQNSISIKFREKFGIKPENCSKFK